MTLKDKLPVSYLLFTNRGRIDRLTYWTASVFIWTSFYILFYLLNKVAYLATWIIYPILFWALISIATKRLHDTNKSGKWLWLILIPVFGPLILIYFLGFKKGNIKQNNFGKVPGLAPDYHKNGEAEKIEHLKSEDRIINDVTQLNPIIISKLETPTSIEELQNIIKKSDIFSFAILSK